VGLTPSSLLHLAFCQTLVSTNLESRARRASDRQETLETVLLAAIASGMILALGISLISAWLAVKRPPPPERIPDLEAQVMALRNAVTDVVERTESWMRRDRVRRSRETAAQREGEAEAQQPNAPVSLKSELRRRAFPRGELP
jgi:hypothetical protein